MEQGRQHHERKRGKRFWILMTIFNTVMIIGFAVVMVRRSSNDKSERASLLSGNERQNGTSRIIGGTPSHQNKFPYYVDTGNCGGALIAPKIVLSAAHCGASGYAGNSKVIVNGPMRGAVGAYGKLISWSRWSPHPEYSQARNSEGGLAETNDLALYLLDEPVKGLPVTLSVNQYSSFPADGTPVAALGMGAQNRGSQLINGVALPVHDVLIPVINAEECRENFGSIFNTDTMMCAGATGKGICYGDSGGPLVVRNGNRDILVGITSMVGNVECAKSNKYDNVFARVSAAFPWIQSVVCDQWGEQADFCTGNPVCFDETGWSDPDGYDCQAYASTEATGVRICEYHKDISGAGGLSPIQACCVCNYVTEKGSNPSPATNPVTTIGSCSDSPGWTDPNGYDCAAYASTEATGVRVCEYHKDIPGAGGLTPVQVCCVCNYVTGQGSNPSPPTNPGATTGSCSDSPGWTDPNGYDCAAYAATEVSGIRICEYHRDIPGVDGLTPIQACCVCK